MKRFYFRSLSKTKDTMSSTFNDINICVVKKTTDGWSEPRIPESQVNMGEGINSSNHDDRPYVTRDGKYFFFTRYESDNLDIYWVDAKVIENFKP